MPMLLLVDDEADVRNFLKEELGREGYQVHTANNGADAIVAAAEQSFDAIVLDMLMPGLDGIQVIRVLRKVCPQTPIIGLTGYVGRGYMAQASAFGVVCLSKPVIIVDLLKELNAALSEIE
jgi:CheY-like chemotaxis protein